MTQITPLPKMHTRGCKKARDPEMADWDIIPEVDKKPNRGGNPQPESAGSMANPAVEHGPQEITQRDGKDPNIAAEQDSPDIPCKKLERQALADGFADEYAALVDDMNRLQNNRKLFMETGLRDMSPEARKAWREQVTEENRELMERLKSLREKQGDMAQRRAKERKETAVMSSLKKIIAKDPLLNGESDDGPLENRSSLSECDADSTTSDSFCKISSDASVHSGFEIMHFPHDDTEVKDDW
ncbi:hypothetical protein ACJ41O_007710 [Fusarium nematophilum]